MEVRDERVVVVVIVVVESLEEKERDGAVDVVGDEGDGDGAAE